MHIDDVPQQAVHLSHLPDEGGRVDGGARLAPDTVHGELEDLNTISNLSLSQEEVKAVVVLTGQFVVDVSQLLGNEQGVRVSAGHRRTLRAGTGHLQLLDVRGGETLGTVCRLTRSGDCIEFFVELRVSVGGDILHYGAEVCQSAIEAIKLSRDVHGGGVTYNEY